MVLIALISSLPLLFPGIEGREGQDLGFHLMRIEGIAQELKNGVFPVKMQSLWMDGYGYPVSVYYGDLLLYLPALFRLMGVPVLTAYKLFVFLLNLGTAVIARNSFSSIFERDFVGILCSAVYTTAGYRFCNLYVRAAVGEACAMMFLPMVAAAVWKIYHTPDTKIRADRRGGIKLQLRQSLLLSLGLSGLIGTHLLTTEMAGILLLTVGLVFWKRTFSKRILPTLAFAVPMTVLLNLYFLIPFFDYYCNVSVYLNRVLGKAPNIQEDGAELSQLLAFWAEPFQNGNQSTHLLVSPGPALLLALVLVIYLVIKRKASRRTVGFAVGALLLLWVSTCYFPWDAAAQIGSVGRFLAQVQFPWRYLSPAVLLLTLTLGSVMMDMEAPGKKWMYAAALLACLGTLIFTINYARRYEPVFYKDRQDLNTYDMGMIEYLPFKTERKELTGEIRTETGTEAKLIEREGSRMRLYCRTGKDKGMVEIPILSYPGYHIVDEQGNEYNIREGKNHEIQWILPANFAGELVVSFEEPWYWRVGELLSLLGYIGTGMVLVRGRRKL